MGARLERGWRQHRRQQRAIAYPHPARRRLHQSLSGTAKLRRLLPTERWADVAVAARHRRVRCDFLYEQSRHRTFDAQRSARHRQAQAHLDHVLHLHRNVRLLHRLFGGLSAPDQDSVSRSNDRHRLPGTARRLALAAVGRLARRQGRRRDSHVLEFHCHGRRHARRHVLHRSQGIRRLPGDVSDRLRHHRCWQWFDLPHDPVDLPRGETAQGDGRRNGKVARLESREHRKRRCARFYRRHRRLRRLSNSARLRRFDRGHRRSLSGAEDLPHLLRDLPRADLVVLPA